MKHRPVVLKATRKDEMMLSWELGEREKLEAWIGKKKKESAKTGMERRGGPSKRREQRVQRPWGRNVWLCQRNQRNEAWIFTRRDNLCSSPISHAYARAALALVQLFRFLGVGRGAVS